MERVKPQVAPFTENEKKNIAKNSIYGYYVEYVNP